jgi:hypothetical protein
MGSFPKGLCFDFCFVVGAWGYWSMGFFARFFMQGYEVVWFLVLGYR